MRFKGFNDDWEQRKLGEVTEKIGSGKTPKGGNSTYQNHGVALIRSQNIFDDRVNNNDIAYISEKVDNDMKNSRVFKNDVLLNITGASIGRSAVYQSSDTANVNQHVCIIRPKDNISSNFIQLNISSSKGQKEIELNQAGGGREGLNFQQIAKMNFSYPTYDEQQMIGLFFEKINGTIALHQHELTLLKQRKKAFLQKMFPKKGETVPELRFKGFSDAWDEVNLLECVNVYQPSNLPQCDFTEIGYPVYGANGFIGHYSEYNHMKPQIAVACRGNTCGTVNLIPEMSWITSNAMVVNTYDNDNLDFNYMFHLMTAFNFDPYIAGSGQPQLTRSSLVGLKIQLPSLEEQQHIGQFFKTLDDTIEQHTQKAEAYKEMKQAFLQKMFV